MTTQTLPIYDAAAKAIRTLPLPILFQYEPTWFGGTTTVDSELCPVSVGRILFDYPKDGQSINAILPPSHQVAVYIGGAPNEDETLVGVACPDTWKDFLRHHGDNPDHYAEHITNSRVICAEEYAVSPSTAPDWA